ncbi:GNAT family N-acetyltransferase [Bacillus sp. Marseille-Q1617]|uniref:GNAT family N-acetyltransferase n=1 Tax=Bacillus sp. Marseille-Q1617 TaxID=2736887 RepID=UPI001588D164|nr:GNAT family N-acetyltransferase [Bacillus sp. Marseille-Q1617]
MFKSLTTNRLQLRPFTKSDAPDIQKLASNKEVAGIIGLPQPYLLQHAIDWIDIQPALFENGTEYPLAITLKETDELIGTITLRVDKKNQKGELGYWIGQPYWGRGLATEAVKKMMNFGIEDLGLNKIFASALSKNTGSIAVLQKAGLKREGVLKEDRLFSGHFEDIDIYGIVKKDYESNH